MLKNYFNIAWRNLRKHNAFAVINISGLALGLTAFWLITLYVADEMSYDRFHANADQIYRVVHYAHWGDNQMQLAPTSAPFGPALQAEFPEVKAFVRLVPEGGGVITYQNKRLKADDVFLADKNIFRVFSYPFLYGNPATALAKPDAIVLTESLAVKIFGSAATALNKTVKLNDQFTNLVTGVIKDVPENSHVQFSALQSLPANFTEGWQYFHLYTYLLLAPEANAKSLEAKLPAFAAKNIQKEMGVPDYRLALQPIKSIHLHSDLDYEIGANGNINTVYIFMAAALLILLIAIINYMNLTTARSFVRVREVGVRKVLGANQSQLIGLFLTESFLLTFLATVIAIFSIELALPYFNKFAGKELSVWQFGVGNTLFILVAFSFLISICSGSYPALFLSCFRAIPALKGQLGNLSASLLFRKSLVVFQFIIAVTMIFGSLVIYKQLSYAQTKDLGFNKEQVLTFHLESGKVREQVAVLKAQLLQSPFIEGAAVAGNPIGNNNIGGLGYWFDPENTGNFNAHNVSVQELMVDADFLQTLEIKLLAGRNFSRTTDQFQSMLINETLMKKLGLKNPIGIKAQFNTDDKGTRGERAIIGVVKDFHTYSLQHKVEPMVLVMPPVASMQDNVYVKIQPHHTAEALAYLTRVFKQFDPNNALEINFLDQNFARQYEAEQKQGKILLLFTILAVFISGLGLYGLATFTAAQRTKEIGIRKVLGATVANIVAILSKDFLKLVLLANVIAWPIAWWAMHNWLQNFAFKADLGLWIFVLTGVATLLIAMLTVSFQAVRSAVANPVESLRSE
ncbi:ABC transporter permease [Adhaeribacter aerolatus]|uniref:ABC transporter permease n=1 Tax=Adhaeribacter aerolatus TaxID=670289 RepID=A0A512AXW3_9BACT|nr:ABC transporter permease [Adhaeribacter aerolatus]GEO04562.1 ABC transporter permease [Adhaeribacter aerolatus]